MKSNKTRIAIRQRGMALISSLLLLIIITVLAASMFRSFTGAERIAGNLREKDRALHAAESAQQFAESWLLLGNNTAVGSTACTAPLLNANLGQGEICSQTLQGALGYVAGTPIISAPLPWTIGLTYTPPGMTVAGAGVSGPNQYFSQPGFYIADLGQAADAQGEAYQIDAYGYGGAATTVAVVESTYEVSQGVVNRGGL